MLDRARELLEIEDHLDRRLLAPVGALALIPSAHAFLHRDQGVEAANAVRAALNLGETCIEELTGLVEQHFGLAVAREPLPYDVQGLLVVDDPTGRDSVGRPTPSLVLVNSRDVYGRQRFTLAHELGHLLFGDAQTYFVDYRGATNLVETRANYFAAALLMPAGGVAGVAQGLGSAPDEGDGAGPVQRWNERLVAQVAVSFHSSFQSAIYRCNTLGYFDSVEAGRLNGRSAMEILRETGHDDYEDVHGTGMMEIDPPAALTRKALHAYSEGLVGIGTLARLWKTEDANALRSELAEEGWVPSFD